MKNQVLNNIFSVSVFGFNLLLSSVLSYVYLTLKASKDAIAALELTVSELTLQNQELNALIHENQISQINVEKSIGTVLTELVPSTNPIVLKIVVGVAVVTAVVVSGYFLHSLVLVGLTNSDVISSSSSSITEVVNNCTMGITEVVTNCTTGIVIPEVFVPYSDRIVDVSVALAMSPLFSEPYIEDTSFALSQASLSAIY